VYISLNVCVSAVLGPPVAPVISDVSAATCTVNFGAPEMLTGGLPVTGYFLDVRMAHLPWTRVNKFPIVDIERKVTRLHPGIEYEFRLTALSDNGCGEYSTVTGPVIPTTENRPSQPGCPVDSV